MMYINNSMNDELRRDPSIPLADEPSASSVSALRARALQGIGAGVANARNSPANPTRIVRWIAGISDTLKQLWGALLRFLSKAFARSLVPIENVSVNAPDQENVSRLNRLSPNAILHLSAAELHALSSGSVKLLSFNVIWGLADAVKNELGFGRLNDLSEEEVGRLSVGELNALKPVAIKGLWCDVLNYLSDETLGGLSADVVNGLSLETLAQIDPNILNKLSPAALAKLEPCVLNALPLDPLPMLRDEVKRHLTVKAVRWRPPFSMADVLVPNI